MTHVESFPQPEQEDSRPGHLATSASFLAGGGEMGERIRTFDWESTSLGPVEQWPQSLKTVVRIMLISRQPIWIGWGPELIKLYNDPYKAIVGGKHPQALGQPAAVVWREIWDAIGPRLQTTLQNNEGTYDECLLLLMERYGYPEETYYTFSYSPVPADHGGVGGIICANTDDTARIIGERQVKLLQTLAAQMAEVRTGDRYSCYGNELKMSLDRAGDGKLEDVYFVFVYTPLRSATETVEGIMVFAYEVTEQVLARQRLTESEARFRTLAESIPNLVWIARPDGWIYWYNSRWYDYTGTTLEQMKGWGWQSMHDPQVLPEVLRRWHHSLRTEEPFEMVFLLKGTDGVFRSFLTRIVPLRDSTGTLVQWFGTSTDITEQKRLEQQKDEFIGVASH